MRTWESYAPAGAGTRTLVRYSPEEWKLLGEAMYLEMKANPENLELTIIQLANQAQKNQIRFLLGDMLGQAEWPERKFTQNGQLERAIKVLHALIVQTDHEASTAERLKNEVVKLRETFVVSLNNTINPPAKQSVV